MTLQHSGAGIDSVKCWTYSGGLQLVRSLAPSDLLACCTLPRVMGICFPCCGAGA